MLDIMGEPADNFAEKAYAGTIRPLDPKRPFGEACRDMRTINAETIAMATIHIKAMGHTGRRQLPARRRDPPVAAHGRPVQDRAARTRSRW